MVDQQSGLIDLFRDLLLAGKASKGKERAAGLVGMLAELKGSLLADGQSFPLVVKGKQTMLDWIVGHIGRTDVRVGTCRR